MRETEFSGADFPLELPQHRIFFKRAFGETMSWPAQTFSVPCFFPVSLVDTSFDGPLLHVARWRAGQAETGNVIHNRVSAGVATLRYIFWRLSHQNTGHMPRRYVHLLRGEKKVSSRDVHICNVNDLMNQEYYHLVTRTTGVFKHSMAPSLCQFLALILIIAGLTCSIINKVLQNRLRARELSCGLLVA